MRIKRLLIVALVIATPCANAWTGISAFIGEDRTSWDFSGTSRRAELFRYGLSIEDKTAAGLRIGVAAGNVDLDLIDSQSALDQFGGEFAQLYLRWPVPLGDYFTFHSRFDYRYNRGRYEPVESTDSTSSTSNVTERDVAWFERSLSAGIALRLGMISLQPFARYLSSDGDITDNNTIQRFKLDHNVSHGLIIDLHVEKTAYVRLLSEFSETESLQLHFVRAF